VSVLRRSELRLLLRRRLQLTHTLTPRRPTRASGRTVGKHGVTGCHSVVGWSGAAGGPIELLGWLRSERVEPPTPGRVDRVVRSLWTEASGGW